MATAAWRSSLRTASFRGVQFKVSSADREAGRRTVTHEFLGRDEPYVEDLGRKARTFSVEGYVLGPDYMPARDALLAACEEQGPGRLVLPWSDEVTVQLTACRVKESQAEGGMATFSLQFTEAGAAATPTGAPRMDALVDQQADDAMDAADEELDEALDTEGRPSWVAEALQGDVRAIALRLADALGLGEEASAVADMDLAAYKGSIAELLRPLYAAAAPLGDSGTMPGGTANALLEEADYSLPTPVDGTSSHRKAVRANTQALSQYHREACVAQACRAAAYTVPPSRAEAATLRTDIGDGVDNMLDNTRSDAVYARFTDLRRTTVAAITANAGNAPQVTTLQVPAPRPSLVLAHLAAPGQDPTRIEADMVARNRIRHPGFPDCYPLEVITRG